MLEINKKEFFENFNQGDIIGLDNLEKQLKSILAEVHDNMKANVENEKIINNGIAYTASNFSSISRLNKKDIGFGDIVFTSNDYVSG